MTSESTSFTSDTDSESDLDSSMLDSSIDMGHPQPETPTETLDSDEVDEEFDRAVPDEIKDESHVREEEEEDHNETLPLPRDVSAPEPSLESALQDTRAETISDCEALLHMAEEYLAHIIALLRDDDGAELWTIESYETARTFRNRFVRRFYKLTYNMLQYRLTADQEKGRQSPSDLLPRLYQFLPKAEITRLTGCPAIPRTKRGKKRQRQA
ncbi:hypothetical protein [Gimesia sp.]|uniref:hypothetical protein n=1 Tax=Gimesia sp. TaxID=2024833 RepID=UPI003A952361